MEKSVRLISFNYENKSYEVDMRAYDSNLIELPEGDIIEVGGWLERYPPIPQHLSKLTHEKVVDNKLKEKAISARLIKKIV